MAGLAALSGGWMLLDGTRALVTGDYARIDGELGPWAGLVEIVGLDAEGTTMKIVFVTYGVAQVGAAIGYSTRQRWGRPAMIATAVGSLWYLVLGTASGVLQLGLLAVGQARNARTVGPATD